MEKEFISYTEALALKELGFDEPCLGFYDGKGDAKLYFNNLRDASGDFKPFIRSERLTWFGTPLYQQAFRWFSKKHRIEGWVQPFLSLEPRKCQARYWDGGKTPCEGISIGVYDTYEEAELECLKKLIEIVKDDL
jgi:hypothetical protein